MRDGICMSLKKRVKATPLGGIGLSLGNWKERMLVELFREEALKFHAEYVGECALVKTRHVHDDDTSVTSVKARFVSRASCRILNDDDNSPNRKKVSEPGGYVLHEQKLHATN